MISAMLAAQGIHGPKGKCRSSSDLQAQVEEEQVLTEPEQLQLVGFLPQTLRVLAGEELLGGHGTPTPLLAGRVEQGQMSSSSPEATL